MTDPHDDAAQPKPPAEQPDTADMYHFRSRVDLMLFSLFIIAVLAAVTFWLLRHSIARV